MIINYNWSPGTLSFQVGAILCTTYKTKQTKQNKKDIPALIHNFRHEVLAPQNSFLLLSAVSFTNSFCSSFATDLLVSYLPSPNFRLIWAPINPFGSPPPYNASGYPD